MILKTFSSHPNRCESTYCAMPRRRVGRRDGTRLVRAAGRAAASLRKSGRVRRDIEEVWPISRIQYLPVPSSFPPLSLWLSLSLSPISKDFCINPPRGTSFLGPATKTRGVLSFMNFAEFFYLIRNIEFLGINLS